jgi:hypothetical protein
VIIKQLLPQLGSPFIVPLFATGGFFTCHNGFIGYFAFYADRKVGRRQGREKERKQER